MRLTVELSLLRQRRSEIERLIAQKNIGLWDGVEYFVDKLIPTYTLGYRFFLEFASIVRYKGSYWVEPQRHRGRRGGLYLIF